MNIRASNSTLRCIACPHKNISAGKLFGHSAIHYAFCGVKPLNVVVSVPFTAKRLKYVQSNKKGKIKSISLLLPGCANAYRLTSNEPFAVSCCCSSFTGSKRRRWDYRWKAYPGFKLSVLDLHFLICHGSLSLYNWIVLTLSLCTNGRSTNLG